MKNLLALLAFAVICFAAVGWFLNWYRVEVVPTEGGRHRVNLDLNTPKINDDLKTGREKLAKILESANQAEETKSIPDFPTMANPVPAQPASPQAGHSDPFVSKDGNYFVLPVNPNR